jgi:ATP-dependent Clp protease ATP-binding subunit ClpC
MNREILPKVKAIINQAIKEAKSFDDVKVRPEHIILSTLLDNDNDTVKILKSLNIETGDLYDKLSDYIRKTINSPSIVTNTRKSLPMSSETAKIIKAVDKECEKLNDASIDAPHVFLAILLSKLQVNEFLNSYGINYQSFKTKFKEMRDDFPNGAYEGDEQDEAADDSYKRKAPKQGEAKSKTPVLDNFCRDVSKAVEKGEIDPVVGRAVEIKRVSQILSRRKKNNPILIGEPGVGKTSIVEGLAQLISDGNAPRTLMGKRIFTLDLASIVAGTKYRGQFEERMKAVLEECKANPDIILFIDELHTIVGAGNASGSLDASNIFKPALARGELQVIGATTLDEYRENIEKDGALTRRFQQVLVEETTLEETKIILTNIKEKYEKHHKVK